MRGAGRSMRARAENTVKARLSVPRLSPPPAMPELPDLRVYVERGRAKLDGQVLRRLHILSPFVLRTALPPIASIAGRRVLGVERVAKRIVLAFEGQLFLVMHLMIAGRLRWLAPGGIEVFAVDLAGFVTRLCSEKHTLKRALSRLPKASWPRSIDDL